MFKQINQRVKYKDTEGLGFKVPVENIVGLATTIGVGALTGGIAVAGEAGIAGAAEGLYASGITGAARGALSGISSAAPSIGSAAIAGGVGAGINTALGGGTAGNIIGGAIGGLASRGSAGAIGGALGSAVGSVSNRVSGRGRPRVRPINNDNHPLLQNRPVQQAFSGEGNIVGGRATVSRLVREPQIQEVHNRQTGEITTWVVPAREQVNNIGMAINRQIKNASETVSNLRNQISDAGSNIINNVRGRGRPRLVPRSDEIEPYPAHETHPVSVGEIQTLRGNDKSLSILQAAIKRTKQNKTLGAMRWENEMAQNEQNRNAANTLKATLKRAKASNEYASDIIADNEAQKMAAASRLKTEKSQIEAASKIKAALKRTL